MPKPQKNNFAYIDGANLHKGIGDLGWQLDYFRLRRWLLEKYSVTRAYLFLGLVSHYTNLYTALQEAGFMLVFKETTYDGNGKIKGNCDADLVLHAVRDAYEGAFRQAVIITGDGDYASLITFLQEKNKLQTVLAPNHKKCSILLKRTNVSITYLNEFQNQLSTKEKAPGRDGTRQGSFS